MQRDLIAAMDRSRLRFAPVGVERDGAAGTVRDLEPMFALSLESYATQPRRLLIVNHISTLVAELGISTVATTGTVWPLRSARAGS